MSLRLSALLILFSLFSMLPNISYFSLWMEESRRALVAFEMFHSGNWFQPTLFGELYYNKPPLFNWLIAISAKFFGWNTLSPRAVTLFFLSMTLVLIAAFSFYLFRNLSLSLMSALFFLTFSDILFWYGWLAEIDMTLSFFCLLMFFFFIKFYESLKPIYLYLTSIVCGLVFMLKGFPAFAFWGASFITLVFLKRQPKLIFSKEFLTAVFIALVASFWWIPLSHSPIEYLNVLWSETFSRVESSTSPTNFVKHLMTYPLLNIKQTLPYSVFLLFILWKFRKELVLNPKAKILIVLILVNYLPYLLSASSRGRYILPLLPLIAIVLPSLMVNALDISKRIRKLLLASILLFIVLRFFYGLLVLPYLEERRGHPKITAEHIQNIVEGKELACDCEGLRSLCMYVAFLRDEPLLKSSLAEKDVSYILDCKPREGYRILKEFTVDKRKALLLQKEI